MSSTPISLFLSSRHHETRVYCAYPSVRKSDTLYNFKGVFRKNPLRPKDSKPPGSIDLEHEAANPQLTPQIQPPPSNPPSAVALDQNESVTKNVVYYRNDTITFWARIVSIFCAWLALIAPFVALALVDSPTKMLWIIGGAVTGCMGLLAYASTKKWDVIIAGAT